MRMASQKLGMEMPRTDTKRLSWSAPVSCFTADMRPRGMPTIMENTTPRMASSKLTGTARSNSSRTGLPL